ncbi:hypothetical protein PAMP_014511 [Pampus punctatissimus]
MPVLDLTSVGQESSGLDKFPVDQYQNSCYLFWIVEELLQKSNVPCRVEGFPLVGLSVQASQRLVVTVSTRSFSFNSSYQNTSYSDILQCTGCQLIKMFKAL